jgi:hypothetical protein
VVPKPALSPTDGRFSKPKNCYVSSKKFGTITNKKAQV